MLILTRKVGESIRIGDDILVKVVEIRGGQIRLAINAPLEVRILREEIYDRIKKSNLESVTYGPETMERVKEMLK